MIGEIRMFGGNFAPRSWALCQGQLLAISGNEALFSILGTTYGGDGRTTFALPDLRGRAAVHAGTGPGLPTKTLGARSGNEETTLSVLNLPSHTHAGDMTGTVALGAGAAGTTTGAGNSLAAAAAANVFIAADPNAAAVLRGNPVAVNVTLANTGNNQAFTNMMPYQVVNYIIALQGIFPSRN
ncbi:MAG: tail fiber protein [Saprospiraceae bacterium]